MEKLPVTAKTLIIKGEGLVRGKLLNMLDPGIYSTGENAYGGKKVYERHAAVR